MSAVREQIELLASELTASERKVASVLLADYPFAGLQNIQGLAAQTGVSAPSITRFINKIGCNGYLEFQRLLIGELKQDMQSPVTLKLTESPTTPGRFLSDYANRIASQIHDMANNITQRQFDDVCDLLADPSRNIFLLGGRVSDNIAAMLAIHLRQIRARIHHLPGNPEFWPDYILRMRKRDVVILFDFRRYQASLGQLADIISSKRQSNIIAITDKWLSPVASHANHILTVPTEIGTAWDGQAGAVALVEAMIVQVSEHNWKTARQRIGQWDEVRLSPPISSANYVSE
jgi:DNA-binding MurR/RpiR family transcriptional regulator